MTPIGSNVVTGWLNGLTDSLEIQAPVDPADQTLLGGGEVDIQLSIPLRMGSDWETIGDADSIELRGSAILFSRTVDDVLAVLNQRGLLQGDSIVTRVVISDRVGNITNGDASEDTLVYDPNRPTSTSFVGGVVVTQDTVISSDTLSAVWSPFVESTPATASGINRYEWAVEEVGSGAINGFQTWTSVGTDTSASGALALEHLKVYRVYVRAFDNAGNISDTLSMAPDSVLRLNSAPVFSSIDSQFVDEDVAFSYEVTATDRDTETILGDTLHYTILDTGITVTTNEMTLDELTGQLVWNTPLQADTGSWNVSLKVTDEWGFADTTSFVLTVNSVNDTPVVSAMPDIQFAEDVIQGDTLSLNQYVTDADDDTSTIVWTAVVAEDPTVYPSYPLFFFGPGITPRLERAVRNFVLGPRKPGRFPGRGSEIRSFSSDPGLTVVIDTLGGSSFAQFVADSNYYVDSRQVTFVATDPVGASDSTSLSVTITPLNDPPRILLIPDTTVVENDTLVLTLQAIDIDDSTVTLQAIPDSSQISVTITDSIATFIPDPLWSRQSNILVIVSDEEYSDSTLFLLDVLRVPRPHLSLALGQNITFSRYYELMITDTAEKALDVTLTVNPQAVAVPLDSVGEFTWVGSYEFDTTGVFELVMHGTAGVGDTTITRTSQLAVARAKEAWSATSSDGVFQVEGEPRSVLFDRRFMIVDSLLFSADQRDGGRYRMGHPVAQFTRPVMIRIVPDSGRPEKDQAIYQKGGNGLWRELPTILRDGDLLSWTDRMGYFKLGKKTLVIPEKTALGMNYPNPFNARTLIPVDVGFLGGPTQRVTVKVYNLLGQEITNLHNGPMGVGRHELVWDGRDESGIPVSSGLYVVRLSAEAGLSQARKIILLR
ncbi:MAG: FlgD immunoglobulin-like domain containing protein [Fidelibacterota bacterium]